MSDSQQKINKIKINKFINSMAWQVIIFTCVYYATVENNGFALAILDVYFWIGVCISICYFMASLVPAKIFAQTNLEDYRGSFSTTGNVLRYISSSVSIVEIILFINYDLFNFAILWIVCELLQFAFMYNLRKAFKMADAEKPVQDDKDDAVKLTVIKHKMDNLAERVTHISDKESDEFLETQKEYKELMNEYSDIMVKSALKNEE